MESVTQGPPGTAFSKGLTLKRSGYKATREACIPPVGLPVYGWRINSGQETTYSVNGLT